MGGSEGIYNIWTLLCYLNGGVGTSSPLNSINENKFLLHNINEGYISLTKF